MLALLALTIDLALIFTTISNAGVACQTQTSPALQQWILTHPVPELASEDDYLDEIANGHRIRDVDKFTRQKDCLCLKHLKDPHCGSNGKEYDNGCFFLCAQQREKGLRLRRWGTCPPAAELDDYDNDIGIDDPEVEGETEFDDLQYKNFVPAGFVES